jgi:hypothetical protein
MDARKLDARHKEMADPIFHAFENYRRRNSKARFAAVDEGDALHFMGEVS